MSACGRSIRGSPAAPNEPSLHHGLIPGAAEPAAAAALVGLGLIDKPIAFCPRRPGVAPLQSRMASGLAAGSVKQQTSDASRPKQGAAGRNPSCVRPVRGDKPGPINLPGEGSC